MIYERTFFVLMPLFLHPSVVVLGVLRCDGASFYPVLRKAYTGLSTYKSSDFGNFDAVALIFFSFSCFF